MQADSIIFAPCSLSSQTGSATDVGQLKNSDSKNKETVCISPCIPNPTHTDSHRNYVHLHNTLQYSPTPNLTHTDSLLQHRNYVHLHNTL